MQAQRTSNTYAHRLEVITTPLRVTEDNNDTFQRLKLAFTKIWNKLRPSEQKNRQDYLKQMCYLALADHHLSEDEQAYIRNIGKQIQVEDCNINTFDDQPLNQMPLFLSFPSRNRFFYVFHLINLIRLSKVAQDKAICRAQMLLMKQGYAPDTVDIILATIEQNEKAGASYQQTYDQLKESLS